tara:strand:- start:192 stop:458 length:267 start_codon:yes stop_codon:yes gene_type:complete
MEFDINDIDIESRFEIYDNLSKQMLDRLEKAIDRITESNHTIAVILERHENRLQENSQSNELLVKMVEELKDDIDKKIIVIEHKNVST